MLKKLFAFLMLPIQILLLIVMLPLMLVFGSSLLGVLVPPIRRPSRPTEDDEEEIKEKD
ncbi:MAG: hypothetical protein IPK14_18085 [Blastocatellia bacterium]|nr:hypothetical protein [Blastocatellia bacterium]MBL8192636.1 hypothetical protein [Blastocatellia bacterium]MBN8724430.1 hypothetical protein [Acidobacteriota bacterium]